MGPPEIPNPNRAVATDPRLSADPSDRVTALDVAKLLEKRHIPAQKVGRARKSSGVSAKALGKRKAVAAESDDISTKKTNLGNWLTSTSSNQSKAPPHLKRLQTADPAALTRSSSGFSIVSTSVGSNADETTKGQGQDRHSDRTGADNRDNEDSDGFNMETGDDGEGDSEDDDPEVEELEGDELENAREADYSVRFSRLTCR
jgi:hypothetical protein